MGDRGGDNVDLSSDEQPDPKACLGISDTLPPPPLTLKPLNAPEYDNKKMNP